MAATGGVHAAARCTLDGGILHAFEDVGRHNAPDKLVGHLAHAGVDMSRGFVFLSSRASYELVRKATRMGIPMVATISAPTSLAIDIAQQAGMRLVSFCRHSGFVEYTGGAAASSRQQPAACGLPGGTQRPPVPAPPSHGILPTRPAPPTMQ